MDIRAEVRTGDTPAAKRQSIIRKPPHILVTTPESFYLLLTSESGRKLLAPVRTVIVDEIHAVVGNRRGSHLALSIERLAALAKRPLQRIGLSATQKPIEEVARFLTGRSERTRNAAIVNCDYRRQLDLAIELPGSPLEAVMSNEVWEEVYGRLADLIAAHRTTLVFANTRRLAERVAHNLGARLGAEQSHVAPRQPLCQTPPRCGEPPEARRAQGAWWPPLRSSSASTSARSIWFAKSVRPIRSRLFCNGSDARNTGAAVCPKDAFFRSAGMNWSRSRRILRSVRNGELDALQMPQKPLDVLAQQIVACAASEDWKEEALFELMRRPILIANLRERNSMTSCACSPRASAPSAAGAAR